MRRLCFHRPFHGGRAKTLLRDGRQPVWPIDKVALEAQGRRGMIVAGVMAILALLAFWAGIITMKYLALRRLHSGSHSFCWRGDGLQCVALDHPPFAALSRSDRIDGARGALGLCDYARCVYSPVPNRKLIYVGAIRSDCRCLSVRDAARKTRHPPSGPLIGQARPALI